MGVLYHASRPTDVLAEKGEKRGGQKFVQHNGGSYGRDGKTDLSKILLPANYDKWLDLLTKTAEETLIKKGRGEKRTRRGTEMNVRFQELLRWEER